MWRSLFYLLKRNDITEKKREKRTTKESRMLHRFSIDLSLHITFFIVVFFSLFNFIVVKSCVVVKLMRSHISWVRQPSMVEGGRITLWFDDSKRESTFYAVPDETMFSLFIEYRSIVNFLYTLFSIFNSLRLETQGNVKQKSEKYQKRDENSTRRPSF